MADDPLLPVIRLKPDLANIVSAVQAYAAGLELG